MDCRQAEPLLASSLEGPDALGGTLDVELEGHLGSCPTCTARVRALQALREQVRSLPRPQLPAGFRQRFHLALAAEPLPTRPWHHRFLSSLNWPSMALGAAAAAAFSLFLGHAPDPGITLEANAVPLGQNVAVQVAFEVQEDVDDVTFDIRLPEGLRFVDAKGKAMEESRVTWQGQLRKGRTVVPIAVRPLQPGRWEIQAVVRKARNIRETHIVLPVRELPSSGGRRHHGGEA